MPAPHPSPIVASTLIAAGERSAPEEIFSLVCESPARCFLEASSASRASGHRASPHRALPHTGPSLVLAGVGDFLSQGGEKILQPREDRMRRVRPNFAAPGPAEAAAAAHHSAALPASVGGLVGLALWTKASKPAAESARSSGSRAAAPLAAHGWPAVALHSRTESTTRASSLSSEPAAAKAAPAEPATTHPAPGTKASGAARGRAIGVLGCRLRCRRIRPTRAGHNGKQSHGASQRKHAAQHKASTFLQRHRPPD